MGNDRKVVLEFIDIVCEELSTRFGEVASVEDVIFHLCERGIIQQKTLRNRVISFEYPIISSKGVFKETAAEELAEKHDMSDRQIKRIVKESIKKFSANHNIK